MNIFLNFKIRLNDLLRFFQENFSVFVSCFILALSGILAYRNAFGASFIFDDLTQILQNPHIQSWHWPWAFFLNNRRPVLYLTLAVNYYFDGFNPVGYHAFNIRVHILAAIVLFLLVRKTLLLPCVNVWFKKDAHILALASALIWLLHPIHTQAVTYIIQRAESLMGLFFLTAVYFSSCYLTSRRVFWLWATVFAGLLCGLTKEVALVLPVVVLLYDRAFFSQNFFAAVKNHRWLYAALSLTWFVMVTLYLTTKPEEKLTAGFGMRGMTPFLYAVNQPAVILHYLHLAFWPNMLIFDYQWPAVSKLPLLLPSIAVIAGCGAFLWMLDRRFRQMSFLGISFFVLLLPSSSIIPLKDLIFEYRLYLSLSVTSIVAVFFLKFIIQKCVHAKSRQAFFIFCVALLCLILGGLTYQRNKTYLTEESVWRDVVNKQPTNARAYNNLGEYWLRMGRYAQAKTCFLKSIFLDQKYADVFANMATVLGKEGKTKEAVAYAQDAVKIDPDFAIGYNNLGSALSQEGRYKEAVANFEKALALGFVREGVLINLGVALNNSGNPQAASKVLKDALRLYPASAQVRSILGEVLGHLGEK